jgi:hypothetical protein
MSSRTDWTTVVDAARVQTRDALWLLRILTRAQEILAEPATWTRGALARSLLRRGVLPTSELAVSWSASGALALALFDILGPSAARCDRERLYDLGIRSLGHSLPDDHPRTARISLDIDGFNDYPGTVYQDIMQLFERALLGRPSTLS